MRTLRRRRHIIMGQRPAQAITGGRWMQPPKPSLELVTNGVFSADSNWTKGAGWTIAGGVATGAAGSASALTQGPVTLVQGKAYWTSFDIVSYTAGGAGMNIGATLGTLRTAAGHYEEIIVAGAASTIIIDKDATFGGSIDNVSVREALRQ